MGIAIFLLVIMGINVGQAGMQKNWHSALGWLTCIITQLQVMALKGLI